MGRSRYRVLTEEYPVFITSSVQSFMPVFEDPNIADILLGGFRFLREKRAVKLQAYVIMPNHIHAILYGEDLRRKINAFKSFTARSIIDYWVKHSEQYWLDKFRIPVDPRYNRFHRFWQFGYHPKSLVTGKIILQKIEYIHQNPVKKALVCKAEDWKYSSARNYLKMDSVMEIDPIHEWI